MYELTLEKAGLTLDQAAVYEVLLKNGPLPAGEVSKRAELKRGLTYKVLDELVALGLVAKNSKQKVLRFEATHPLRLKELAEQKEQAARVAQEALGGIIGNLTSDFNLISGRPGVRYYEGDAAIRILADDTLVSGNEVLTYLDYKYMDTYLPKENARYIAERVKKGIHKRIIGPDTEYVRSIKTTLEKNLVSMRLIPADAAPFTSIVQIYDQKVSFLSLTETRRIGVIIDDPYISTMHRTLFESLWKKAEPLTDGSLSTQPSGQ
jgi:sugar-specific transcriptional regulator TrmB